MNLSPTLEEELDLVKPVLGLILKFEDPAFRYLTARDERFRSAPDEQMSDLMEEVIWEKNLLEALRLPSRLQHELLEECRGREWYKSDRETLSRHTALLALLPGTPGREKAPAAPGEFAARLLEEREALSRHYPHLYAPAPGGFGEAGEDPVTLSEAVHRTELMAVGVSEEEWEEIETERAHQEVMAMAVQEVDPLNVEESLAVWGEVSRAGGIIASENGKDIEEEAAEMIRSNLAPIRSVLTRFVLESLLFRLMREEGAERVKEQFKRWLVDRSIGPGIMGEVTRGDADRSLDLMGQLFSDPAEPCGKMMAAAQYLADLGDPGSAWNMVQAVLSRREKDEHWPELALKGVFTQLRSGGRQEELARALLAWGEREGDRETAAAGRAAMAIALHSLGRSEESARYHGQVMRDLLAGRGDPHMLSVYPLAASISLEMGDKKSVRKLAGAGLRNMEEFPHLDDEREQLLEMRQGVDRVDKGRKGGRKARPGG